jgi:uncharacterized lipoprotein YddW (UPF0748 family)
MICALSVLIRIVTTAVMGYGFDTADYFLGVFQNNPSETVLPYNELFKQYNRYGIHHYFINAGSNGIAFYDSDIVERSGSTDYVLMAVEAAENSDVNIHLWHQNFYLKAADEATIRNFAAEGRLTVDSEGRVRDGYLNPLDQRNRQLDIEVITELVSKYDVSGINLDYLRFAGQQYDYSSTSRRSFEEWLGHEVSQWPDDVLSDGRYGASFSEFRRAVLTDHLREISSLVRELKPELLITIDVFPEQNAKDIVFQNWEVWARDGLIDALMPMIYTNDLQLFERKASLFLKMIPANFPVYLGIGTQDNQGKRIEADVILAQMDIGAELGAAGCFIFQNDAYFISKVLTKLE